MNKRNDNRQPAGSGAVYQLSSLVTSEPNQSDADPVARIDNKWEGHALWIVSNDQRSIFRVDPRLSPTWKMRRRKALNITDS